MTDGADIGTTVSSRLTGAVMQKGEAMDDLISRQAAIDALDEQIAQCNKAIKSFVLSMKDEYAAKVEKASLTAFRERLEYLPPAQPQITHEQAVEYLQSTGWMQNHDLQMMLDGVHRFTAHPEPCEDAVSRKAVKDGFVEMCNLICPYTEKQRHTMCGSCLLGTAFDVLEATQPVTPKQGTDTLKAEIKRIKRSFKTCINSDYYTGYMSALSAVEGCIAQLEGANNDT